MGRLTTHVLDTAQGRPGKGIRIEVFRLEGEQRIRLKEVVTNDDGRCDGPSASTSWSSTPATTCVPRASRPRSRASWM